VWAGDGSSWLIRRSRRQAGRHQTKGENLKSPGAATELTAH